METDALLAELMRIHGALERSRQRLGEAAEGLGALRAMLGGEPPTAREAPREGSAPAPQVVSNVSPGILRAGSQADAIETVKLTAKDLAGVPGPPSTDAVDTVRVPRPAGRTLPGAAVDPRDSAPAWRPDGVDTARVPRPAARTLPGAGADPRDSAPVRRPDGVDTARVPRPEVGFPGSGGAEPPSAKGGEGRTTGPRGLGDPPDERPTGEYQRPQRETLTYFFGVDGPAPDEETELGPVGGSEASGKRTPEPA